LVFATAREQYREKKGYKSDRDGPPGIVSRAVLVKRKK